VSLHETVPHGQTCCCAACKFARRKLRFENVSRATYDGGVVYSNRTIISLKLPPLVPEAGAQAILAEESATLDL
jgi:hypothetical protein